MTGNVVGARRRVVIALAAVVGLCAPQVAAVAVPHTADPAPRTCQVPHPTEGKTSSSYLPGTGTVHAEMLFAQFPDAPAGNERPKTFVAKMVRPAEKWYAESSYGRMHLKISTYPHWLHMPKRSASYQINHSTTAEAQDHYLREAVKLADPHVNFHGVQIVYVVSSATANIPISPAFIVGTANSDVRADGTTIGFGSTFGNDIRDGSAPVGTPGYLVQAPRILEHETGHMLGLPDLYDYASVPDIFASVGWWDPMSDVFDGTGFLGWQRRKLGWIRPTAVRCIDGSGHVTVSLTTLDRKGGTKLVLVQLSHQRVLAVEARRPAGTDAGLSDSGVLIYVINGKQQTGDNPIVVKPATRVSSSSPEGALSKAAYNVGDGQVSTYSSAADHVAVQVLSATATGWKVAVAHQ
jgi:M6 family metalloprotease-like protein